MNRGADSGGADRFPFLQGSAFPESAPLLARQASIVDVALRYFTPALATGSSAPGVTPKAFLMWRVK